MTVALGIHESRPLGRIVQKQRANHVRDPDPSIWASASFDSSQSPCCETSQHSLPSCCIDLKTVPTYSHHSESKSEECVSAALPSRLLKSVRCSNCLFVSKIFCFLAGCQRKAQPESRFLSSSCVWQVSLKHGENMIASRMQVVMSLFVPCNPWWAKSVFVFSNWMFGWKPRRWTMSFWLPSSVFSTKSCVIKCTKPFTRWPIPTSKLRHTSTMLFERNCPTWNWMLSLKRRKNWLWQWKMRFRKPWQRTAIRLSTRSSQVNLISSFVDRRKLISLTLGFGHFLGCLYRPRSW